MAVTPKPLGDGQLGAGISTLYTVPASTRTRVQLISLVNTDSSARTVNLYVNPSGTRRRILPKDYSIPAGEQVVLEDMGIYLDAADLIEGSASAATVVDYFISGVEFTS